MNHSANSNHKIRVALYSDKGTLPKCLDKSVEIISKQPDMDIVRIQQRDIIEGKLSQYDVLLFPGGGGGDEARSLGQDGSKIVTEFAKSGKGVIGTCAGAYLLGKGWNEPTRQLELINSEVNDLDHWARGEQPVVCEIVSSFPKLNKKTFSIHYENGPPLVPSDLNHLPPYVSLAKYVTDLHSKDAPAGMMGGKDAIIAAPFGKGKVLLFSSHPELTPGLENMLVQAVRWSTNHSDKKITWENVFGNYIPMADNQTVK